MKRLDLHTRSLRRRYALAFTILAILTLVAFKASAEEQQFSISTAPLRSERGLFYFNGLAILCAWKYLHLQISA